MLDIVERFSEYIRGILAGGNVVDGDLTGVERVANEVVTDVEIFGRFLSVGR